MHKNIIRFDDRPFGTIDEMDEALVNNWNSVVSNADHVYHLDADCGVTKDLTEYTKTLINARNKGAMFDSRVFTIPKEEVCNALIWRQQDATRNSIQSVGQANFNQKELHGKSCNNIQDMLMTQKGVNWNDYATTLKRGSCCIKVDDSLTEYDEVGNISDYIQRSKWVIDNEIPIFTQDRNYVEKLI